MAAENKITDTEKQKELIEKFGKEILAPLVKELENAVGVVPGTVLYELGRTVFALKRVNKSIKLKFYFFFRICIMFQHSLKQYIKMYEHLVKRSINCFIICQ